MTTLGELRTTYRAMAPVYDLLFRRVYRRLREESLQELAPWPSARVVIVGAGTGQDLAFIPRDVPVVAIDATPQMLVRAAAQRGPNRSFVLADGARLPLRSGCAAAVILHLVLSVAPDPAGVLAEAARVLEPGGRVVVLDHFAPPGGPGLARRLLSRCRRLLGTRFDLRFEELPLAPAFTVCRDVQRWRGVYRLVTLERRPGPAETELPREATTTGPPR